MDARARAIKAIEAANRLEKLVLEYRDVFSEGSLKYTRTGLPSGEVDVHFEARVRFEDPAMPDDA